MFREVSSMLDNLVVLPERALAEVNAEYSTTTELADVLQREADVPFRIGHHFASELVDFGRQNKLKASEIPYADAARIYTKSARQFGIEDAKLPLDEARFRSSLSAENMVHSSKGLGGPQPAEVRRMLDVEARRLADDEAWSRERKGRLSSAQSALDATFAKLMQ
jgi:argininosuccinate lyase